MNTAPLTLGNRPALDGRRGRLDEVRVWRRALLQTELQANDRTLTRSKTDFAAYYPLEAGAG